MVPGSAVRIHDHYQLELKLSHPLLVPSATFEMWVYLPNSLGIDEPQFKKESFYADLTTYTRFRTPRASLGSLFAEGDPTSPLQWLARHGVEVASWTARPDDYPQALRSLRLLAAVYRVVVRDTGEALSVGLATPSGPTRAAHLDHAMRFIDDSRGVLDRFRRLRAGLPGPRLPADLDATLHALEEFLSLQALEAWFRLLRGLQGPEASSPGGAPLEPDAAGLSDALRSAIRTETQHRIGAGMSGAPVDDPGGNEPYIARVNQLKKWVLAVLHLRLVSNRRAERARDFAFSFAAAVAMSVAVLLQLFAIWTVGTPTGPQLGSTLYAFVGLAVGGYILKDAIKDKLKGWFQAGIPHWLFDRRHDLCVGTTGRVFGAVEETVTCMTPGGVGTAVSHLRELGEDPLFAGERAEDDVVHYRRRVRLSASLAREHAPEMVAVDEIIRLNVGRWLRRMDDPVRALSRLGEDGRVVQVQGAKTYRVTMILSLPVVGGPARYEKVVVVVTREGIVRIERP